MTEVDLKFSSAINEITLRGRIEDVVEALQLPKPEIVLRNDTPTDRTNPAFESWKLQMNTSVEDANRILESLRDVLGKTPVFMSSSEIGSQVAGDTQSRAIYALLVSLVGITLYVWLRFHSVIWGIAAVLALVHDVLMMLGAIAVSYWLEPFLGVLLVEEFKINQIGRAHV